MFVYRISKKTYGKDLSGIGAGIYGGRWNPKGLNMVYSASSIALASLEFMVHNYHLLSTAKICMAKIEIASPFSLKEIPIQELPKGWNLQMQSQFLTQKLGKEFLQENKHYILKVPSAVIPGEYNLLLNPFHKEHSNTKVVDMIDPFVFDKRLFDLSN